MAKAASRVSVSVSPFLSSDTHEQGTLFSENTAFKLVVQESNMKQTSLGKYLRICSYIKKSLT